MTNTTQANGPAIPQSNRAADAERKAAIPSFLTYEAFTKALPVPTLPMASGAGAGGATHTTGNPFATDAKVHSDLGFGMIAELHGHLAENPDPTNDVPNWNSTELTAATLFKRGASDTCGRIITGLISQVCYELSRLDTDEKYVREAETKLLAEDVSDYAIAGLVTKADRSHCQYQAREARIAQVGALISGMVAAFEHCTGSAYVLPTRADPAIVVGAKAKSKEEILADIMARRAGRRAA